MNSSNPQTSPLWRYLHYCVAILLVCSIIALFAVGDELSTKGDERSSRLVYQLNTSKISSSTINDHIDDALQSVDNKNAVELIDPLSCELNESICDGSNLRSALSTISGGVPPYSYAWNTGATTSSIDNLQTGIYSLTITDDNDSETDCDLFVNQCFKCDTVCESVFARINGHENCFTNYGLSEWGWTNGLLMEGSYAGNIYAGPIACGAILPDSVGEITIEYDNDTVIVTYEVNADYTLNFTNLYIGCDPIPVNSQTGIATVAPGLYPFQHSLTNAKKDTFVIPIDFLPCEGIYLIANAEACHPSPMSCSITGLDAICFGSNSGFANATVIGGNTPYSYEWSTGETTEDLLSAFAGIHTLTVTDAGNCTTTCNVTINQPPAVIAICSTNHTNDKLDCFGDMDGEITVVAGGGVPGYSYLWSNGATTSTISNLGMGTYSVTVVDSKDCIATCQKTLTEPPLLVPTCTTNKVNDELNCFGDTDGKVTATPSGGTAPYDYVWNTTPALTTMMIDGLGIGTYQVTVTDAKGCTATCSKTLTQPPLLTTVCTTNKVNDELNCFGDTDGKVTATPSGGTAPYGYVWNTTPARTTMMIDGLGIGTYQVTVTDAKGCTATCSKTLTQPPLLTTVCTTNKVNDELNCFGDTDGEVTATPSGGTAPYDYVWNTTPARTTMMIDGLGIGTYQVTVTDAKGCTATCSKTLTQPPLLTTVCTTNKVNDELNCFGDTDGKVTATPSGGTAPYGYVWNTTPARTTMMIDGLGIGTYQVTVTDAKGCTATCSKTLTQPPLLTTVCTTNKVNDELNCFGDTDGKVTATPSGGTAPYDYVWNTTPALTTMMIDGLGIGTYQVTVTDAKGCTATCSKTLTQPPLLTTVCTTNKVNDELNCFGDTDGKVTATPSGGTAPYGYVWNTTPARTTMMIDGLGIGTYQVTVTDAKGCTATCSKTLTQPPLLTTVCTTNKVNDELNCFGDTDGEVTATPSGGTAPYGYVWNTTPPRATMMIDGLGIGTYQVTVTDAKGCTATCSKTLTQPPLLTTVCTTNKVNDELNCFGDTDGSVTATPSGGTAPYGYVWNTTPARTTMMIDGLGIGTYQVTVTDAIGCTATCSKTLTQPPLLTTVCTTNKVNDELNCFGDTDGKVTATPSGGTAPYGYVWNTTPTRTTMMIDGLGIGTYQVTVTDAKGCTATCSKTLTQPPLLTTVCTTNKVNDELNCFGDTDGKVTATPSGGTAPYGYVWNTTPTRTTMMIDGLGIGTYEVTVTDAKGCTATCSKTLTQPPLLTTVCTTNKVNDELNCFGDTDGKVTATPSGGTAPYGYVWNTTPARTTMMIDGLGIGTYEVTVTDAKGCTATCSKTLTQPPLLTTVCTTNKVNDELNCFGDTDGSVTATPSGGTAPYGYVWNTTPARTTMMIDGLGIGTYQVTVTDAKGCTATCSKTLTQPPLLTTVCTTNKVNDELNCFGDTDGKVTATPSGGTAPYGYVWNTTPTRTTMMIDGLGIGTYEVTVTDAKGCTATCSKTLTQPPLLTTVCTTNKVNDELNCFGDTDGSVTATPSGGTAPYGYVWNTTPARTTMMIDGLGIGTYQVTVTDAKGCTATCSKTLTQPPLLTTVCTTNKVNDELNCFGDTDGKVTATPSGGTAPYGYVWNTTPTRTTMMIDGLGIGTYQVTVTDAKGCTATCSKTLTQPPLLTMVCTTNKVNDELNCFGDTDGKVTATPSGGTAPYGYVWNTTPARTTMMIDGLGIGTYQVTVTDAKGCTATCSKTLTQPPLLTTVCTTNKVNDELNCFGDTDGKVTATPSGGTAPYGYVWNTTPARTTMMIDGLGIGTYQVTVTDAKGCTATCSKTLTQPPLLTTVCTTNKVNDELNCFGDTDGKVTATPSGGTAPYGYVWNTTPPRTTMMIDGLGIGTYQVTVTDAKGCTATCSKTLTQPPLLTTLCTTNKVNDELNCFGDTDGKVTATPSGGTPPYGYVWNTTPARTTMMIDGLGIGTYQVTVTDAKGCTATCSKTLTQPPLLTTVCTTNKVNDELNCFGDTDGKVTATPSGGTAPYGYVWNTTPARTTMMIDGLGIGTYQVTVTDAKGCTATCSKTLTQPPLLTTVCTTNKVNDELNCFGDTDGKVTATPSGGTAPYGYVWNTTPARTTMMIDGLGIGTYEVTVTDAKGCTATCSKTLTQPPLLTTVCTTNKVNDELNCFGDTDGSVTATPSGGTAPYGYVWNTTPARTTMMIDGLGIGTYQVTVTDAKGCTATCSKTLTQPPLLTTLCTTNKVNDELNCFGDTDGKVTATPSGGTPPYDYVWNTTPARTTMMIDGLGIGTYQVTVTDAKGCTATCSKTLTQPPLLTTLCTTNKVNDELNCFGDTDGKVTATPSGGTPPYDYVWNTTPARTTMMIDGLGIGTYQVTVTDAKGCSATCSKTLTQPPLLTTLCTTNKVNDELNCFGDTDGKVTATPSGGTPPYDYVWNTTPARTTMMIDGLGIGTYQVTVTDAKGCTATCSKTLTQPPLLTMVCTTNKVNDELNCFGDTDGKVTATPSGGTAPYGYVWNTTPPRTTMMIDGLGIGTYQVTVTDAKGCAATCSKTLTQPPLLTTVCTTNKVNDELNCFGDTDGKVTATPSGGTAPYGYVWNTTPTRTTMMIDGLGIGTYEVTVTDAKGCTTTCSKTLTQQDVLICEIMGTNVACNTSGTGQAAATVHGGTMPYDFTWSNGATTDQIMGLAVGTYTLTVTDAKDCVTTCDVFVDGLICSIVQSECDINNLRGAISNVSGGLLPYSYAWSTGETTPNIEGLIPGIYSLVATDANECETECEVTIDRCNVCDANCATSFARYDPLNACFNQFGFDQWGWSNGLLSNGVYTFDLYAAALNCDINAGELVGQVTLDYNGDIALVTYNLFGDYFMTLVSIYVGCDPIPTVNGIPVVAPSQYPHQQILNDVTSYTYSFDVNNLPCEGIYVIAHAEVCSPDPMTCSITGTPVDCNGGSDGLADASVFGGMAPYTYLWSTGATTEDIGGLAQGIYELTITDVNNCTSNCQVWIAHSMLDVPQIGPYCQNDAPFDISNLLTDPNLMGNWSGEGVIDGILYPSNMSIGQHILYYDDEVTCQSGILYIEITERCCPLDYAQANGRMLIGTQSAVVHYETDGILESEQSINANTIYDSKTEITLYGTFEVELGHEFDAIIDGCP